MKLSRQLLVLSLLVLVLPAAGVRWVQEMELTFREQQVQVMNASLRATAASLALRDLLPAPVEADGSVYVQPMTGDLVMDGYFEDWLARGLTSRNYESDSPIGIGPSVSFSSSTDDSSLYLAFSVKSEKVVYYSPVGTPLKNGDRVQLSIGNGTSDKPSQLYTIVTEAPGPVVARTRNAWNGIRRVVRENRIRGYWRDIPGGYQLELMLPLSMIPQESDTGARHFGFTVLSGSSEFWAGSVPPDFPASMVPGTLILPDNQLSASLQPFLEDDMRLGVLDAAGWQIAQTGAVRTVDNRDGDEPFWLLSWFYRMILSWNNLPEYQAYWRGGGWQDSALNSALDGQPHAMWQRYNDHYRLLASWPLVENDKVVGALIAEQGSNAVFSLASRSFNRLFSLSFMAIFLVSAGLLGYASWLSLRVRKLHKATEQYFRKGRDGNTLSQFPVSRSRDELGDLSRSIDAMLNRQQEQADYLRSLGSKLSHELRTPLAVVRSSLDNLEHVQVSAQGRVYASRALAGADRLGSLLNSISEATRLENIISDTASNADREIVDLCMMLEDLYQAYSGVYPESRFKLLVPEQNCSASIVPELVVQAIDKLVSNAVDFCAVNGVITLSLRVSGNDYVLSVENDGNPLPETMQGQLFDSMVSVRTTQGNNKPHLGLGLYIVRLVMESHSGRAVAENRTSNNGVVFLMVFPIKHP